MIGLRNGILCQDKFLSGISISNSRKKWSFRKIIHKLGVARETTDFEDVVPQP